MGSHDLPQLDARILVTGGAGFIGSHLVRTLIHRGVQVLNYDKWTYAANPTSLSDVAKSPNYRQVVADVCDSDALNQAIRSFAPQAIFHLAAESHVDHSIASSAAFIETNIVGTHRLLGATQAYWESLSKVDADCFRLIHVSTDEVFGSLGDEGCFDEHSAYDPRSPYAASKAASDHLARAWRHTYGVPTILTHSSNNYGPFQFPEKLIPVVITRALSQQSIPIYGTGKNVRDWIHVQDHCDALLRVWEQGHIGTDYLIGARNPRSNWEVATFVCDALDGLHPGPNSYRDRLALVTDRPGHDWRYEIDPTRIEQELGWRPLRSFEVELKETVRWYVEHTEWWQAGLKQGMTRSST